MLSAEASARQTYQMIKTFQGKPGDHHYIRTENVLVAITMIKSKTRLAARLPENQLGIGRNLTHLQR